MAGWLVLLAIFIAATPAAASNPDEVNRGTISGVVVDAETGETLPGATVRLLEAGRGRAADSAGRFSFTDVLPRTYTLAVQHIGYAPSERTVRLAEGDSVFVNVTLRPSALEMPAVVITGTGRERGAAETYRPTAVLAGAELQRQLESSLAGTIEHLPGIAMQYNGPAASQPVIRGLGGDRVLMLEDGQRTGDLVATGADHAVMIDPVSAERIEVVRGPAGLLYGSNALGGVINVVRHEIPRSHPDRLTGTFSASGETVMRGAAGHVNATLPVGTFAVRGELTGRLTGDVRTPLGVMPRSDQESYAAGAGISMIRPWGFVGASYREQGLDYGVPGEFNGEAIPGAHTGGVDIETHRRVGRVAGALYTGVGPLRTVEFDGVVNHYRHEEIEGVLAGRRIIGTSFDNLSGSVNLVARHEHENGTLRNEGAFGLFVTARDLIAGGNFTGTRSAQESGLAGYVYEEFGFEPFRVQAGVRYDWRKVSPRNTRPIQVGDRIIQVGDRSFHAVSGSLAGIMEVADGIAVGISLTRSFRSPAIEELYSAGPHLADFSFDIGDPDLDSEVGYGADLFVRVDRRRLNAEFATFFNRIHNFIYYRPTGDIDPRLGRFPVFQATADDADFLGAEGRVKWEFSRRLVADVTASYVRATRLEEGDPLPNIPPLSGRAMLRYERRRFFSTASVRVSADQERVPRSIASPLDPGERILPQRPTDGFLLLDAGSGMRFFSGAAVHTVSLRIANLTNAVWRDHLSRIKDVAPMPGRNVQLTYRVQF
jgi:iron complex outermembrane recepter protein